MDVQKDMTVVKYWSDTTDKIFKKLESWIRDNPACNGGMDGLITSMNPYGSNGYYSTDKKRKEFNFVHKEYKDNCIKSWTRNYENLQYSIHYIEENILPDNVKYRKGFGQYKLIWAKSGAPANWRNNTILEPNVIFSDTFIGAFFNTMNEAENYRTYFKTLFYRCMITETTTDHNACRNVHRHCPDLSTITNPRTGLVGWDSDWTDDDLKILFDGYLDDADWKYITETALKSDNYRT